MVEIKESTPLLDANGCVLKEGWARHPYWDYNASGNLKNLRRSGWDSYTLTDPDKSIAINAMHANIIHEGLHSITYIDYSKAFAAVTVSEKMIRSFLNKNLHYPSSSNYYSYFDSSMVMSFVRNANSYFILLSSPEMQLESETGLKLDAAFHGNEDEECIACAFSLNEKGKGFIYAMREAAIPASGKLFFSDNVSSIDNAIGFHEQVRSDGRGKGRIYSVQINAQKDGRNISICANAKDDTMNAVYSSGRIRKMSECILQHDGKKWILTDKDNTISMVMHDDTSFTIPDYKGIDKIERKCIAGIFSGSVILPDGRECLIDKGFGQLKEISWKEIK